MSVFNGAGILGTELGALLTSALGVSAGKDGGATDFTNLGLLVTVCNLSSLLPLLALGFLDEAPIDVASTDNPSSADDLMAVPAVETSAAETSVSER